MLCKVQLCLTAPNTALGRLSAMHGGQHHSCLSGDQGGREDGEELRYKRHITLLVAAALTLAGCVSQPAGLCTPFPRAASGQMGEKQINSVVQVQNLALVQLRGFNEGETAGF